MARRKKKEEHVNHERWLVSYADFITLLFAFFTSMYAISTVDAAKAGKMVFSTRSAFNLEFFPTDKPVLGLSSEQPPPPVQAVSLKRKRMIPEMPRAKGGSQRRGPVNMRALAKELQDFIAAQELTGRVSVRLVEENLVVSLAEAAFFDSGAATIRSASLPVLDEIAEKLMRTGRPLRIEGHTDDRPISSTRFRSNWQLSASRAVTVVSYLIEEFAYPPELLSAAGYSSYRPVSPNTTAAGRALNRRVDMVLAADPVVR